MGVPLPAVSAVVVTLVESLGGLALVLGVATRSFGTLLALDMAGAILFVHREKWILCAGGCRASAHSSCRKCVPGPGGSGSTVAGRNLRQKCLKVLSLLFSCFRFSLG